MASKFPPGLLNPGPSAPASGFCERFFRVECPNGREFVFNLLFSSYGVWLLLPLSVLLLLVYRLVGPPEVDEREEELRQQWADHRRRFQSGAKRSVLRGVIKSSYLTELSESGGRKSRSDNTGAGGAGELTRRATSRGAPLPSHAPEAVVSRHGGGVGGGDDSDDDADSWEDVRPSPPSPRGTDTADIATAGGSGDAATAPPLPPPRETVHLLTTPGPTRVTIVGDREGGGGGGTEVGAGNRPRLSVLTLHAAGHNHRTCLGALEREVAKDEELGGGGGGGVVFYHVDTPGHEEEATGIEAKALSLEAQAVQLLEVTIQLRLTWFVGLGVGAGANVLLRFACDNPDRLAGLIVANGSAEVAGRRERNTWLSPRFRLSWESDMKAAREALVPLSFPPHSSLGSRYRAGLGTMHSGNVLKYVDASLCRDDIPVSRLKALNDVWVLLLCGTDPPGSSSSAAGFLSSLVAGVDAEEATRNLLDRLRLAAGLEQQASKATLVKLDGGGAGGGLLEAKPREVLAAMKLFLNKCF